MAVGNLPGRTAKPDRALGAIFWLAKHGKSGGQGRPRSDAEETASLAPGGRAGAHSAYLMTRELLRLRLTQLYCLPLGVCATSIAGAVLRQLPVTSRI